MRYRGLAKALVVFGTCFMVFAVLALWAEFTPVAALLETRYAGTVLAALALAAFAGSTWLRWGATSIIASGVAILVLGWGVKLLLFTYNEEPVQFSNGAVKLMGTLYLPRGDGPFPAIILLHGSGVESRAESRYLAKLFARHGIAGLIYDKRGAGSSGGDTYATDYHGYAADALEGIRLLQTRGDIAEGQVGIFGHSEGGWVAPLVVEKMPDVAFVIVTSSTHLSPAEQELYETGADLENSGYSEKIINEAVSLRRQLFEFHRTGVGDPSRLQEAVTRASTQDWFDLSGLPQKVYPAEEYRWWRSVMDFDSAPYWARVRCPVLAVSGGLDRKMPIIESHAGIEQALEAGGNPAFTSRVFPRMEHGTIEWWIPGRIPPPRFPSGYPQLLVEWSWEQLNRRKNM
jgi:pimeloyl-ACP methyl ester carboxylesterase